MPLDPSGHMKRGGSGFFAFDSVNYWSSARGESMEVLAPVAMSSPEFLASRHVRDLSALLLNSSLRDQQLPLRRRQPRPEFGHLSVKRLATAAPVLALLLAAHHRVNLTPGNGNGTPAVMTANPAKTTTRHLQSPERGVVKSDVHPNAILLFKSRRSHCRVTWGVPPHCVANAATPASRSTPPKDGFNPAERRVKQRAQPTWVRSNDVPTVYTPRAARSRLHLLEIRPGTCPRSRPAP